MKDIFKKTSLRPIVHAVEEVAQAMGNNEDKFKAYYSPEQLGIKIKNEQYIRIVPGETQARFRAVRTNTMTKGSWDVQAWNAKSNEYQSMVLDGDPPTAQTRVTKQMFDRLIALENKVINQEDLSPDVELPPAHFDHDRVLFHAARREKIRNKSMNVKTEQPKKQKKKPSSKKRGR